MAIDWEVEYNNRARVPEHPQIFERWVREAAAYRDQTGKEGRAEIGLKYGPSPRQTVDIFKPRGNDTGKLVLFIHGGYWRSLEPSMFSQSARGMNEHGITVAVSGYDLVPQVTIGQIVEQTRATCLYLWKKFGKRFMVSGHSVGGHLAACLMATDWKSLSPDAPADLTSVGYAISGIYDLAPILHLSGNAEFKLDAAEAKRLSPLFWPVGQARVLDAVVGGIESSEFLRHSREIATEWGKRGVETRYEAIPGKNHFDICDPLTDPNSGMTRRMVELAKRT